MSAPDPADPSRVIDLRAPGDGAPTRVCPSCGAALPPRRLFCTDYCRTALHRIRRTEADIRRLREMLDLTSDAGQAALYTRQIDILERRVAARSSRLADHRSAQALDLDANLDRSDVNG